MSDQNLNDVGPPKKDLREILNNIRSRSSNQADSSDVSNSSTRRRNQSQERYSRERSNATYTHQNSGRSSGQSHSTIPTTRTADDERSRIRRRSSPSTRTHQPNKKPRKEENPFIRYNDRLTRLLSKDPSEIIMALLDDHEAFCEFLNCDHMRAKSIEEILEIFSKLYDTPYTQNFTKIFDVFQDAAFLKHLQPYILGLPYSLEDREKKKMHLEIIIRFFNELMSRFPNICEHLPLDALFNTYTDQWETKDENETNTMKNDSSNDNITPQNSNTSTTNEDRGKQIKDSILKLKSTREEILRRKHSSSNTTVIKNAPPDDYKSIPVFPRREDIFPENPPFLRKNIIRGRYTDVTHYLDVQFRLLREDYIAPIRDGVLEATGDQEERSRSIYVYRNVRVVGRLLDTKSGGLLHRVRFDVSRMRRVNWEHSKRFKYGSLFCLIDSNTKSTMYFITITERNPEDLKKGLLNVKFFDDKLAESIADEQQFFMIESPAYFESYRHVLEGLQNFNKDNLPFQRYLVECTSEVRPPVYLVKSTNPNLSLNEADNLEETDGITDCDNKRSRSCYDLTKALACEAAKSVSVLDPNAWPSPSQVDLNDSQYNALKAALTEEFVVIQGPPGTGKTFVGLRIANALLRNKSFWRRQKPPTENEVQNDTGNHSPILVVCYTNHALDQFLEGILQITDSVARVGGRGKSKSLERFNLKTRKRMTEESFYWRDLKRTLKDVQAEIEKERLVIKAADKKLRPNEVENFLTKEEKEQLRQWERVAYQMGVHRIEAWLKMQDEVGDCRRKKRKQSSSTSSVNDETICNNLTAKRSRNTVDSAMNLNRDVLSEHVNPSASQELNPRIEEQENSKKSFSFQEPNLAPLSLVENAEENIDCINNQLEEGELPDSDDEVFYQGNDTHAMTTMDNNLSAADHLKQQKQQTFRCTLSIQAQEPLVNLIPDPTTMKSIANDVEEDSIKDLSNMSNKVTKRVDEPSSSLVPQIFRKPNETISQNYNRPEDNDVNLTIAVVPKIAGKEDENIENDVINQEEIMDSQDNDMLKDKHSNDERNVGNSSSMVSSETNFGEGNDKEETIGDNEDNAVAIDKHSDNERDKGKENDPSMSSFGRSSGKENHGDKNSNDRVAESSKMSGAGNSDIFTEGAEKGEILNADDDVSDSDDTTKDDGEDGGIDIASIIGRQIEFIRRGKENTKESVEQTPAVDDEATLSDALNQNNEQMYQVDLKVLSEEQRSNLYQEWIERYFKEHREKIERLRQRHDDTLRQMSEIESIQNERILKNVDVIGMTTTGAAKHRLTLQEIKPRIVIVEEAAEVLEGHVITALSSGTDHLILIGDHKQLKPNPTVYELATKYKLDVSLFERMVKNGLRCHSLKIQHRMRPEIADIMRIIYPKLLDDVSVRHYDSVTGFQQNVYFIDHDKPESGNDELKSPSNQHEVEFVAALCRYLLLQGYQGNKITVLTMYTGQLLKLQRSMPKKYFDGIRISSVDNFQGEESDIIILSLVRSNKNGNIGFLNVSNRVCVALSRAKEAMYCIGNISMMATRNDLWNTIKIHLQQKSMIGISLPLCCPKHPEKKIEASSAEDFKKAPKGGCMSPCEFRLRCGHACSFHCHPVDPEHEKYRCTEKCLEEFCDLKHLCKRQCHFGKDCKPCEEKISFVFPSCNHKIQIECCKRENIKCLAPCTNDLPCGHRCAGKCGEDCDKVKCRREVTRTLKCGHTVSLPCSSDVRDDKCSEPCDKLLDCGHKCPGDCSRCYKGTFHVKCEEPCKRPLVCSHKCKEPCTKNCPPCEMDCANRCNHSICSERCGKLCIPCRMPCMWKCEHYQCNKRCGEMCDREKCNEECQKLLECDHQCVGICGDYCPRLCRICDKEELQTIFLGREDEPNALYIELMDCNHVFEVTDLDYWMEGMEENESSEVQLKVCPKCKSAIRRSLRYGNIVKKTLADIEKVKNIKLDEQRQLREKRFQLRQRLQKLTRKYPSLIDDRLEERVHELRSDADAYNTLENELQFFYRLGEIGEMFFSGSDKLSFAERSSKLVSQRQRIRELLHRRTLLTNQEVKDISENIAFLTLSCQFEYMLWKIEKDFNSSELSEEIKSSIESAQEIMSRQENAVDTALAVTDDERAVVGSVIEDVSRKIGITPLTPEERTSIVKALSLPKGHWYKCRNGHIYIITECGGAMQTSKCPDCQEEIGGRNHRLAEGNELAPEMDGASHSAWSDQANLRNYDPEELRRLQR